jgi:hypothetical protein
MVALASPGKAIGELIVTGSSNDQNVTVNGEVAKSGRTIFSSSTIATPEGLGAIVNLGKAGRISFSPGSTFTLTVEGEAVSGNLTAGNITILSASQSVSVKILNGDTIQANVGDTVAADPAAGQNPPNPNHASHNDKLIFGIILAGALVAILWAANSDNRNEFGGTSTTISPVR